MWTDALSSMSSGVKSTIITATSNGNSIQLSINAVAAVYLKSSYNDYVCGLWYHKSTGLNLSVFTQSVNSNFIITEYINEGDQFRVLYVD